MSMPEVTFYDKHPFSWTEGYDMQQLRDTLAPLLKSFIDEISSDTWVLDLGCGAGRVTACLVDRELRCVGMDLSRASVEFMRQRAGAPGVVGDALRLPFIDGSLDRIISDGVIHHTAEPRGAFAEACRVLKSGGLLYAAVYKPGGHYEKLYRIVGAPIRRLVKTAAGRALVHGTLLPMYFLAHLAKSAGKRSWQGTRNLFYDYFVTPQVEFLSETEIRRWSSQCGVEVIDYNPNPGLNVQSFVFRKLHTEPLIKAASHYQVGSLPVR